MPRNPPVAQVLYYTELVEGWSTGTTGMLAACRAQVLPEPEFSEAFDGFTVVFGKDLHTPEQLRALDLNDRQVSAVLYVKERGSSTNREYREITGVKDRAATSELNDLVAKGVLDRLGTTSRGTRYAARKAQSPQ